MLLFRGNYIKLRNNLSSNFLLAIELNLVNMITRFWYLPVHSSKTRNIFVFLRLPKVPWLRTRSALFGDEKFAYCSRWIPPPSQDDPQFAQ